MRKIKLFISTIIILFIFIILPLKATANEPDYSREYLMELEEKNKDIIDGMDIRILNDKFLISLENKSGYIKYISDNSIDWDKLELEYQDIAYGNGKYYAIDINGSIFYSLDLINWMKLAELQNSKNNKLIPLDISINENVIIVSHYTPIWGEKNYKNGLKVYDLGQKVWKETTGYNLDYGVTFDIIYAEDEFILIYDNNNIFDLEYKFYKSKDGINWNLENNKVDILRKFNLMIHQDTDIYKGIDIIKKQINNDVLKGEYIPVQVFIGNEAIEFDQDALLINGRVMVPLRKIFEVFNGKVEWDQKNKRINGKIDNKNIVLKIGTKEAYVDGEKVILDTPAQIVSDRVLVPVRFLVDCINKKSTWDQNNYIVRIN